MPHDSAIAAIDEKLAVRRQWRQDRVERWESSVKEEVRLKTSIEEVDVEIGSLEAARNKLANDDIIAKVVTE